MVPTTTQREHFSHDGDGRITSWDGPLKMFDMSGWSFVDDKLVRPLPHPPRRGFATRARKSNFNWLPGMKSFVREMVKDYSVKTAPYQKVLTAMENKWTDLTSPTLNTLKNFVRTDMKKKTEAAQHAYARQHKRSYKGLSLDWLRKELKNRAIDSGKKSSCCVFTHHQPPPPKP